MCPETYVAPILEKDNPTEFPCVNVMVVAHLATGSGLKTDTMNQQPRLPRRKITNYITNQQSNGEESPPGFGCLINAHDA